MVSISASWPYQHPKPSLPLSALRCWGRFSIRRHIQHALTIPPSLAQVAERQDDDASKRPGDGIAEEQKDDVVESRDDDVTQRQEEDASQDENDDERADVDGRHADPTD